MRVVGVIRSGAGVATPVVAAELPHGVDPTRLLWERGYASPEPVDAVRDAAGELVLTVRVTTPAGPEPEVCDVRVDAGLTLAAEETPEMRQRVAAYAVVVSERGLLATEFSARTAAPGGWGLPGGGVDPGEEPVDAVRREVHEETAQHVVVGALLQVQSSHWVGRAPQGTVEDFHAVRLIYRAECAHPGDPEVLDVDGTTASARWVPRELIATLDWTSGWRTLLDAWLTP
ncbi:MAG: NUDIX domain-containing protein [Propionibacteriaceae bacterium]